MNGERVKVVEDNEQLGQIVSGDRQEAKNIDERIVKSRKKPVWFIRHSLFI